MPAVTPRESHVTEVNGEKDAGTTLAPAEGPRDNNTQESKPAYLDGFPLYYLGMALMSSGFVLSLDNTILGA